MKSTTNLPENILAIERTHNIRIPMISFIFDGWGPENQLVLQSLPSTLGEDRIYHIALSPLLYNAQELADGVFDEAYRSFFAQIKVLDLKVIFRTMHEPNGGWYPWGGDPELFIRAWKRIHDLSRQEGLTNENILFDFSVNHRDMPVVDGVMQGQESPLFLCTQKVVLETNCFTFEDFYPGDNFVDLVGVSFYNRGKGNDDRKWLSPSQILYDQDWNTLTRLRKFNKPIIIDEVATTAIWYNESFSWEKTQSLFSGDHAYKDQWLKELGSFLAHEGDIIGMNYFNIDYTRGLERWLIGEADWAVINFDTNKVYEGIFDVIDNSRHTSFVRLADLFSMNVVGNVNSPVLYPQRLHPLFDKIKEILDERYLLTSEKKKVIFGLHTFFSKNYSPKYENFFIVLETLDRYYTYMSEIVES